MEKELRNNQNPSVKQVIILMIALFCVALVFIALVAFDDSRVRRVENMVISEVPITIAVAEPIFEGDMLLFRGCRAYMENEPIATWDLSLVLRDQSTMEAYHIPTYRTASAVPVASRDGSEESRRGFGASVRLDDLKLDNVDYDILIYYNHNEKDIYVDTGKDLGKEGLK